MKASADYEGFKRKKELEKQGLYIGPHESYLVCSPQKNKIAKTANDNPVNPVNPVQENPASPKLCVRIPLADGNPDSRVYAYVVAVIGEAGSQKLFKAVYAAGCNMGIGHETNGGVTTLEIAKDELPPGQSLTFAVRPLTSLGTYGKPIATEVAVLEI